MQKVRTVIMTKKVNRRTRFGKVEKA